MKKICLILFVGALLLSSCAKEDVMDRTIFVPDEEDNNLPAYTEWGYNSFGAKYERDYFLVSNSIVPCKILYNNSRLQFSLSGKIDYDGNMTLLFDFPFVQMSGYQDLIQLNNTEIDLSDVDCTVKILQNGVENTLNVLDGKLHFKRAQLLSIDDQVNRVILSGIFDLRFLQDGFPLTISNGRFDVGITQDVFHAY
ncbi:MAG: hypothetical protein LBK94_02000 [Prevotellaceae bacterium]|nr:hypothetical protein [Prevotellaceae bacterium]